MPDAAMDIGVLKERARIVGAIRRFFDGQGFVEVETAVRIPAPAPEAHIDCPVVEGRPATYLRASPELQMKKLLAAGMENIYQIGPCFREGERGARHNPEFTMLEWYRRGADYRDIQEDLTRRFASLGGSSDFKTLRVRDAYRACAGWDPWETWDRDRFDFDMATKVEPAIGEMGGGVFLMDYPPQVCSLARISSSPVDSCPRAERWEFYMDGIELANCFSELCEKDEQLKRFEAEKEERKLLKESDYPIDYAFIKCIPKIRKAAGIALGVDRLVMVLTKKKEISAVRADL